MKLLFAKYTALISKSNYFDRAASLINGDSLIITKHVSFPRLRKQFTSPEDFSQLEYGDTQIELSLLNTELSRNGNTITEFFDEFAEYNSPDRVMKMLCIIDSGRRRWACFIAAPIKANYSYASGNESDILNIKGYDAIIEWKALASSLIPSLGTGGVGDGNYFDEYMAGSIMSSSLFMGDTFEFQNDVDPTAITGVVCRVNKPLLAGIKEGGNTNFTIYNFVKDLAMSWGLVYKFEVPEGYEETSLTTRIKLTFRLMRRADGEAIQLSPTEHYRTQLPGINEQWVFLRNRTYTVRTNLGSTFVEADVAHGILINSDIVYNYDSYNMSEARTIPNKCFVLAVRDIDSQGTTEDQTYKDKLSVVDGTVIKQIPLQNVKIVENELYNLEMSNNYQSFVNSKKFGSSVYTSSQAYVRQNNKIAAHRIFCSSYFNWDGTEPGLDDIMYQLNVLPSAELKVLLRNRSSIEGTASIMVTEPDMSDTFIVPYNGVDELHSVIMVEPNYNLNEGKDSLTAAFQTARIS